MNKKRDTFEKLIAVTTVAALAPASWTKPIVSSVILPTHAMTSTELTLSPIADVLLSCGENRMSFEGCSADDPRVEFTSLASSLSNFITFEMDIILGQNIDENATYSVVNDPTVSNNELGRIAINGEIPKLFWGFGFPGNDPSFDDSVIPIGTFNLILRVENPNGESATTSVNITFS